MSWQAVKNSIIEDLSLMSQDGFVLAQSNLERHHVACPLIECTRLLWDKTLDEKNNANLFKQVETLTDRCVEYIKDLDIDDSDVSHPSQQIDSVIFTIEEIQKLDAPEPPLRKQAKNLTKRLIYSIDLDKFVHLKEFKATNEISSHEQLFNCLLEITNFSENQAQLISRVKKALDKA